jgi:hypothetical protein
VEIGRVYGDVSGAAGNKERCGKRKVEKCRFEDGDVASVNELLKLLKGGDRRSIGQADRVAEMVLKDKRLFRGLMKGLWAEDFLVRMRAADAAEKVTRKRPELLEQYKKELLSLLAVAREQEIRWHLAAMVPRLVLSVHQRRAAMVVLEGYLGDRSSIVKTYALEGMAELVGEDTKLRTAVMEILREAARNGTAAMKARARKLLMRMERKCGGQKDMADYG